MFLNHRTAYIWAANGLNNIQLDKIIKYLKKEKLDLFFRIENYRKVRSVL